MDYLTYPNLPRDLADPHAWAEYGRAWATAYGHRPAALGRATEPNHAAERLSRNTTHPLTLTMHAYREAQPGPRWQALARATWPAYDRWFRARPVADLPTYAECRGAMQRHLPRLVSTWEALSELAAEATGATTEDAARLLSLWRPTPFLAGCSQAALSTPEPMLVRNYDYDPALFEGVVASTNYSGERRVIGTSDCLWGLLDGVNDAGLAVSLTFGGRPGSGDGFGIPLILRALLEECGDVAEAVARARALPVAQAYNLTFLDAAGEAATVFMAPGGEFHHSDQRVATNQRLDVVEHPAAAARLRSPERHAVLTRCVETRAPAADVVGTFLREPVRSTQFAAGFGTLFTAAYRPQDGSVTYRWPGRKWTRRFDDPDSTTTVEIRSAEAPNSCRSRRSGARPGRHRPAGGHRGA